MCVTYWSDKDDSEWFSKVPRKMQQLQVTEKGKKLQLWVKPSKEAHTVSQSLSSEVGQNDKYVIMKSFNSKEEYKVISFSSDDELFKDQKTSSSATANKSYSEIWSMKKEYPPELWNAAYKNILETLQEKTKFIAYEERISLLQHQIILMNQEIIKICKFQQAYKECYKIFKKRKSLLSSNFVKWVEWMWEILNSITHWEEQRYDNIIREYSSIKAWFIKNEGYVTAENDYVLWAMQIKVWAVRQEYAWLDLRTNFKNHVNFIKFDYLESIESRVKN